MRRMQQGFVPCKDAKPKDAKIPPFQAGSDYFISAIVTRTVSRLLRLTLVSMAALKVSERVSSFISVIFPIRIPLGKIPPVPEVSMISPTTVFADLSI